VLVVEDTPDIRELLEEILRFEGYDVTSVEDGAQALQQIESRQFDLVLTDLMMPGVNGLELLSLLGRRDDPVPPVIAMSAFERFRDEACERGAIAFLSKPVDIDVLLREVQRGIERARLDS
jgi:CheY-like chemotaxis protein